MVLSVCIIRICNWIGLCRCGYIQVDRNEIGWRDFVDVLSVVKRTVCGGWWRMNEGVSQSSGSRLSTAWQLDICMQQTASMYCWKVVRTVLKRLSNTVRQVAERTCSKNLSRWNILTRIFTGNTEMLQAAIYWYLICSEREMVPEMILVCVLWWGVLLESVLQLQILNF